MVSLHHRSRGQRPGLHCGAAVSGGGQGGGNGGNSIDGEDLPRDRAIIERAEEDRKGCIQGLYNRAAVVKAIIKGLQRRA